ncbi:4-hydroxybenzoate octaprenyltransferase [Gammaproteobacteria bacterium]|nr:4-hydroxybenzoate octaprenyltransferase [Gammaproteobacteria bacterium]
MTGLKRIKPFIALIRLDKPIGILLLLWPTLWALWIAGHGQPSLKIVVIFILGTFFMRSAGCVVNDFADKKYDKNVTRTQTRPLASGTLKSRHAVWVFLTLIGCSFLLVSQTNELTLTLAVIGVFLASTYPYAKRFTYLPQLHLGLAFGWAIPMSFAAQISALPRECWTIFIVTIIWALIYDTEYAMVDRDDDLKIGVKSTAILFGEDDRLIIGLLQILMIFGLFMVGNAASLHWQFYLSIVVSALIFCHQQLQLKERTRNAYFKAFTSNNYVGFAIFIGISANYYFQI